MNQDIADVLTKGILNLKTQLDDLDVKVDNLQAYVDKRFEQVDKRFIKLESKVDTIIDILKNGVK